MHRGQANEIARQFGGVGLRVLVHDALELFASRRGAQGKRFKALDTRLGRRSGWTKLRIKSPHSGSEIKTCFFVLRVDVIPPTHGNRSNDGDGDGGGDEFRLVLLRPMDGLFRRFKGGLAETVFFQ